MSAIPGRSLAEVGATLDDSAARESSRSTNQNGKPLAAAVAAQARMKDRREIWKSLGMPEYYNWLPGAASSESALDRSSFFVATELTTLPSASPASSRLCQKESDCGCRFPLLRVCVFAAMQVADSDGETEGSVEMTGSLACHFE
jgi:hypothetical protein